jgi:ribosomal protein L7/L12
MISDYYLQSYHNYFWQWEDNLEVITIPNGSTIAYSVFIMDMLKKISPQGLPPFGSFLLATIATNPNGKEVIKEVLLLNKDFKIDNDTFVQASLFLYTLAALPKEYKEGLNRLLLFQSIFKECHNINKISHSQRILDSYSFRKQNKALFANNRDLDDKIAIRDFRTIALLNKKFPSVTHLIEKIAGLPEFDEKNLKLDETEIETQATEGNKDFIDELIDNNKTFHVGSLVRRLWSGLNIPVHSALPSQQPLGGISDLTNKGDFDKLLISEFANDDLVFLSRLANNEALYIQREIPPINSNLKRVILIDISLKNWGTPKSIAYAIAIAIAKHPKTNIECSAFVVGKGYHAVSIDNINEIIKDLQFLDGVLDASVGLNAFFKDHAKNKNNEIFIITEPSTLKRTEMLRVTNEYRDLINYWIYTDVDGNVDVYKKQQNSKKHIQHIQLPLKELWTKKEKKIEPKPDNTEGSKYPILFRGSMNNVKIFNTSDGEVFKITAEKTLFRLYDKTTSTLSKGWEMIYENLPFVSNDTEIGLLSDSDHILFSFRHHDKQAFMLNIQTGEKITFTFNHWRKVPTVSFVFINDFFYHSNQKGTWKINTKGEVAECFPPDIHSDIGGYKKRTDELTALTNKYRHNLSIFKNINTIFINTSDGLVFNTHELTVNPGNHIKLDPARSNTKVYQAKQKSYTEFEFEDGSCIEINKNGLLILKSSNKDIPTIYIPSVLDSSLAVATDTQFAGNTYYLKQPLYKLTLLDTGVIKLSVVKKLKEETGKGLKEVRDMVDNVPSVIFQYITKEKALHLHNSLEQLGAKAQTERMGENSKYLKIITPKDFFKEFIDEFIKHIKTNSKWLPF